MYSRRSERGSDVGVTLVRYLGRSFRFLQFLARSASLLAPGAALGWNSVYVAASPVYDESELAGLKSLRVRVVFLPRPVRNEDL